MNPIFEKSDFRLCYVPVPKGYPQSQTHSGVQRVGNYTILTTSPYPNVRRMKWIEYLRAIIKRISLGHFCKNVRGEVYENPCIYISEDGVHFRLMQSRPLMEAPDPYYGLPAFNSDPDLFIESSLIYVVNRAIFRTKLTPGRHRDEYMIRLYMIKGELDQGRFKYISTNLIKESTELSVSPCITKYKGHYLLMQLFTNCYNDGESFDGLRYVESEEVDRLKESGSWKNITIVSDNYIPWHMSIFEREERLFAIVACIKKGIPQRCWQMLGVFNKDLSVLNIYQRPLTDYNSYRGSAYVTEDGLFNLYTTTVNEKIKGGKSVDGREILLGRKPFEEVLKEMLI